MLRSNHQLAAAHVSDSPRAVTATLRSNHQPAAAHVFSCRLSHLTLMIMPMMAVRLHVLLTITATASRVIPYTIHNIRATDIRYSVFKLMPRCSRSLHTVNSCGIHDINPMAPAVSPIDSIIQSISKVVF